MGILDLIKTVFWAVVFMCVIALVGAFAMGMAF